MFSKNFYSFKDIKASQTRVVDETRAGATAVGGINAVNDKVNDVNILAINDDNGQVSQMPKVPAHPTGFGGTDDL
tara:strand:+ start:809 stop:1033 length:225 start_codon:yes stop_codon:yes gene_type:complete